MSANPRPAANARLTARHIARIAVLGAVSSVLFMFPEIPIIPPIYKLDFSTFPALLAAFSMGPVSGLLTLLIKDAVGLLHTTSMGVGELADFLMSGTFVLVASLIYARRRTLRGALAGMGLGTLAMTLVAALTNYYIMIPFYAAAFRMSEEVIVGMVRATVPAVDGMWKLILLAVAPFNLLKGLLLGLVTTLTYKRLSPLLRVKERSH